MLIFWRRWPLALKLTATTTTIVVLVVIVVTMLAAQRERQAFQAELEQQAALLLDTLSASSADALYFLDADFLSDLMANLGRYEVVTFGRIYDGHGRILADAYNDTLRFTVTPDPFGQTLVNSPNIVFQWGDNQLIAGEVVKTGTQIIGAISVGLPTSSLSTKLASVRGEGMFVATITVLIGLVLALLVSRSITDPLQELIAATEHVREGDLTQRVFIHSGDELALLGDHFNQMTAQLEYILKQMEQEIDERRRAQIQLQAAKDAAEAANRAKSTFLANMSHELRTPLAAVIGYSELMLEQIQMGDYDGFEDQLQRIISAGQHLLVIISDILDLSKIEAGKMSIQPGHFDLNTFVESVAITAEPLMQKRHNQFRLALPADLGHAFLDESKLRQILLNLLGNAAKFTDNGQVTLSAYRERQTDAPDWLHFSVADTGIGIPSDQLSQLFRAFVQVDPSSTRRYEGTGLGLAISQHLCQMMTGHISVTSQVGVGSTFVVHLPCTIPDVPNMASATLP